MYALRRIYRRASRVPIDLTYKFTNIPLVETRLLALHQRAIEVHKPNLPTLSDTDREIISFVRRDGVFRTSLDRLGLPGSEEMFRAGEELGEIYAQRAANGPGAFKDPYLISATPAEKLRYPQLFLWGLNQRFLHVMEVYFGLPVAYNGVNLFYTLADGIQRGSRIWHRDGEDRRTMKVVVYLTDVDIDDGPFEVLHREVPGTKPPKSPSLTAEEIERRVGSPLYSDDVTSCVGPAGTVIFVDTASYYHRGRPATSRNRCALFYNYFSRPPRNPYYCEPSALSPAQIALLTDDLTPYQRQCATWRDAVPAVARLVSPG